MSDDADDKRGAPPPESAPGFVKEFYLAVNTYLRHTPDPTARDVAFDMVEWMNERYPAYHKGVTWHAPQKEDEK
jgi:hypothetical protein